MTPEQQQQHQQQLMYQYYQQQQQQPQQQAPHPNLQNLQHGVANPYAKSPSSSLARPPSATLYQQGYK